MQVFLCKVKRVMAKYTKKLVKQFIEEIKEKRGRVRACRNVGISYQTFTEWTNPKHPRYKAEFTELLKKTEEEVVNENKDYAIAAIFSKMKDHWQAAAWWLERNFPEEFRNRQEITQKTEPEIDLSQYTDEEKELLAKLYDKHRTSSGNREKGQG